MRLLFAAAITILSSIAHAQQFPSRPVTLIVPFPAGGGTDTAMRALAAATEKHLGQRILIENKPGASGTIGPANMAATAAPDGYTVAAISIQVFRQPFLQKTNYDPAKDFTYIIQVYGNTYGVVVRADAPWKTFNDLLDYAKANPGKINYGTPGAGTGLHITMEQIAKQKGINWTMVPFKGQAESLRALLGGHIDVDVNGTGWAGAVDDGKARLLVTWGAQRTKNWPDVPTLRDLGMDMVSNSPSGIAGPKGMDPAVVKVLHDAFRKGMEEPLYKNVMAKLDQPDDYLNTADYQAFALQQIAEQKRLVDELGLTQQ